MERNKAKPEKSMKYWLFSTNPFVSISFSGSPGFFFLNFFPCHFWTCDYSLMRWHIADTYLRGCGRKRLHRIVITDRWKQDVVWLRMWGGSEASAWRISFISSNVGALTGTVFSRFLSHMHHIMILKCLRRKRRLNCRWPEWAKMT